MDSLKLNENVCRICLDYNAVLNWNDEVLDFYGISYKDCYYKYTQLNENESDCFPKNLCEICADDLKNAHFLFDKALESFNVLQGALNDKKLNNIYTNIEICDNKPTLSYQNNVSEFNTSDEETQVEFLSYASDDGITADSENGINDSNEISMIEKVTIEPVHFIDIQNFETSDENLLEQRLIENCDVELPVSYAGNKECKTSNNKCRSLPNTSLEEQHKSFDPKFRISADPKEIENERENYESESTLDQDLVANSNIKSKVSSSSKIQGTKRKKYTLICQYCSLKVNGANHLRAHEATHSENRERNQTCPQCGIKLYTKLSLTEHMKIHTENRQKNHKCEFCEKAFFNKGALNVHRRIHLGLMVKCRICSKEFYRQIDLDKHLLKHSASPLERNVGKVKYTIQCEYCNKSILTIKWREHKAAHLGQPEVKCKICDKNFFCRKKCVKHLQRLHRKSREEYEDFIHYFVAHNTRMSHLKIKQEGKVQPLIE